ncbi:hypothetical protein BH11VER1_BH11VER1_33260 [soil metagenome]
MLSRFSLLIFFSLSLGAIEKVDAATFYWDANGATAGVGGTGTWDTTSSLWRLDSEIGTLTTYISAVTSDAFLTGTAGTLTLNSDIALNTLTFGATSGTYTITGQTLQLKDRNGKDKQGVINVLDTNAAIIASNLDLGASNSNNARIDLNVDNGTAENDLVVSGQITNSNDIFKNGLGKAVFSNTNNTYSGATQVNAGVLQIDGVIASAVTVNSGATLSGSGSVSKAITVKGLGALRPGNKTDAGSGIGTFTLSGTGADGNLTVETSGTLGLQLGANGIAFANQASTFYSSPGVLNTAYTTVGNRVAGANDRIVVGGTLTLVAGSVIDIELNGYAPTLGSAFDVLDWTTFTQNAFTIGPMSNLRTGADNASYDLNLPDITAINSNYRWDVSLFASNGIIVVVPEPSRVILLMAGIVAGLLRRRRKHVV